MSVYIESFKLLDEQEEYYLYDDRTIFNSTYPLGIFVKKDFRDISFSDVTIFYGGNGSGKSTILNIIGNKLSTERLTPLNKGEYFDRYVATSKHRMGIKSPVEIKTITSDDVFDYLLDIRSINAGVNRRKNELSKEYLSNKFSSNDESIFEYEKIKASADAHFGSMSNFIRGRLSNNNLIEHSNGESALLFWEKEIKENGIYILDEPENSLSAENQMKLKTFIEESIRFYNCQFIISTHSPFLLSISDARIYDLDRIPVCEAKWTELKNVRLYYDFFREHRDEFDAN